MQNTAPPAQPEVYTTSATQRHYGRLCAAIAVFFAPRLLVAAGWFWQSWIAQVFGGDWQWPLAGIVGFPWTCMAYVWSSISDSATTGAQTIAMIVALVLDVLSLSLIKAALSRK